MEIILSEVKENGLELSGSYDPAALELNTPQVTFIAPVNVRLKAQRIDGTLDVQVSVRGEMRHVCSRCLTEFPVRLSHDFRVDYKIGTEKSIDVTNDVRDEIILTYPLQILCAEGCKGLCHICGKNLNEGVCKCRTEPSGPFGKLKI